LRKPARPADELKTPIPFCHSFSDVHDARIRLTDCEGNPTREGIGYLQRLASRRFRIPPQDAEDVVAEGLRDFLMLSNRVVHAENLLALIVLRRAADFLRRSSRTRRLEVALDVDVPGNEPHFGDDSLLKRARIFAARRRNSNASRMTGVVQELLAGATLAQAFVSNDIPRGSQGRYSVALRECFEELLPAARSRLPGTLSA
jgi:DNA-directed RNA polymerase specialized sigma24 family protein